MDCVEWVGRSNNCLLELIIHQKLIYFTNYFFFQTCYEMERYLKDEPKLHPLDKLDPAWDLFASPSEGISSWKLDMDTLCSEDDHHLDTLSTSSALSQCSATSWDSAESCLISAVKQEPLDDYEDLDISCYEAELLRPPFRESKRMKRKQSDFNHNHYTYQKRAKADKRKAGRNGKKHNQAAAGSSSSEACHSDNSMRGETTTLLVKPKTESTSIHHKSKGCVLQPLLTPPSSPESVRNGTDAEHALLGHQGLIRMNSSSCTSQGHISRTTTTNTGKCSTRSTRILLVNSQGLPTAAVTQRNANVPMAQASTGE